MRIDEATENNRTKADAYKSNRSHDTNLGGVSTNEIKFSHPVIEGVALVPIYREATWVCACLVSTTSLVVTATISTEQGWIQLQEWHHVENLTSQHICEDSQELSLSLVASTAVSQVKRVLDFEIAAV